MYEDNTIPYVSDKNDALPYFGFKKKKKKKVFLRFISIYQIEFYKNEKVFPTVE